jgi:hypothetical protein
MSGLSRLSQRKADRFPPRQDSELTFALALLATFAIGLTLIFPEGAEFEPVPHLPL